MARFITNPVRLFILILVGFLCVAQADVKLRIYMQDGTLRAGTLITESDQMFVILTKAGREEVPKNKIMYVNGKSLEQWQSRPDKLYQTEILPSEVPNPAYVNDKALPPPSLQSASKVTAPQQQISSVVPPIKGPVNTGAEKINTAGLTSPDQMVPAGQIAPAQKAPAIQAASTNMTPAHQTAPTKTTPVKQAVPMKAEPEKQVAPIVPVAPVASSSPVAKEKVVQPEVVSKLAAIRPSRRSRKTRNKPVPEKVAEVPGSVKPAASAAAAVIPSGRFDREILAGTFYRSAESHLANKEQGRALQDLHKSILLNKGDEKSFVLLGNIYEAEGLPDRAQKYFSNPILKHNKEAQEGLFRLQTENRTRENEGYLLYGETAGGVALALTLAALVRGLRRKKTEVEPTAFGVPGVTIEREEDQVIVSSGQPESVMAKEIGSLMKKLKSPAPSNGEPRSDEFEKLEVRPEPDLKIEPTISKPAFALSGEDISNAAEHKGPSGKESSSVEKPSSLQEVARREREEILRAIAQSKEEAANNKFGTPPDVPNEPVPAEASASLKQHEESAASRDDLLRVAAEVDEALSLANACAEKGDLEAASREYRTAMALDPGRLDCYLGLGFVHFQRSQWDMALHYYMKALSINPDSADAHYGLGRVFLETEQINTAVDELRRSFQLDSTLTDAQDTLAMLGKTV